MKRINDILWQSNDKFQYYKVVPADDNCFAICDRDECIEHCAKIIGKHSMFKKITKEEAEKLMGKKKYIVKFAEHDENELVEAMCSDHARILAQAKRISMGETNVSIRSVEEIKPYVITIDKYTVSVINDELTVKSHGEHVNMGANCGFVIMHLAKRIEELENLLNEMKQDIKDLRDIDILAKLREMLGIPKGKQR